MGGKINRELTLVEGREPNQNMARELVNTAEKMGWKTRHLKTIDSEKIAHGKLDEVFSDFVVWRGPVNFKNQYEIERVIFWLNHEGKITLNTNPAGGRLCTSDKYFQHECFLADEVVREHMLPMFPAISRENVMQMINKGDLQYPFVLKPDFGTRGEGIALIKSKYDLEVFEGNFAAFSAEPYVESQYDWRVFVLGGVALGAMKKIGDTNNESDFMAKSGGRERWNEDDIDVREEIFDLAVRTSAISGLEYSGVDLIRDNKTGRFIVLETNVAGGWQNGFLEATGVHVPTKIVEWFSDRALLFEGKTFDAVKTYVENRINLLSRAAQEKYEKIVKFDFEVSKSVDECHLDLLSRDAKLIDKLLSAYLLIQDDNLGDIYRARIQDLVNTIEKYEISRFGNFVGKDSGSLEMSIEETALYLAISSKL